MVVVVVAIVVVVIVIVVVIVVIVVVVIVVVVVFVVVVVVVFLDVVFVVLGLCWIVVPAPTTKQRTPQAHARRCWHHHGCSFCWQAICDNPNIWRPVPAGRGTTLVIVIVIIGMSKLLSLSLLSLSVLSLLSFHVVSSSLFGMVGVIL